jgi:hypothetical protein
MQDRFDLKIPPDKIAIISMGSIGLVPISVLKVGSVTCGLLLLENKDPEGFERKTFRK